MDENSGTNSPQTRREDQVLHTEEFLVVEVVDRKITRQTDNLLKSLPYSTPTATTSHNMPLHSQVLTTQQISYATSMPQRHHSYMPHSATEPQPSHQPQPYTLPYKAPIISHTLVNQPHSMPTHAPMMPWTKHHGSRRRGKPLSSHGFKRHQ